MCEFNQILKIIPNPCFQAEDEVSKGLKHAESLYDSNKAYAKAFDALQRNVRHIIITCSYNYRVTMSVGVLILC